MRERKRDSSGSQRPDFILRRGWRYCLSAIDGKRKFHIPGNIHSNGWYSWSYELDISLSWVSYRLGIAAASGSAFALGLVQLYLKMNGLA